MKKLCVYLHRKPNGEPFYIGIGSIKRAYRTRGKARNRYYNNIVNKYGDPIVEILHQDLEFLDACEREWMYIQYYGRRDLGTGTLTNLTDGGDGHKTPSEETREKLRQQKLGKKFSEEHLKNLSLSHIGGPSSSTSFKKGQIPWNKGNKNKFMGKNGRI